MIVYSQHQWKEPPKITQKNDSKTSKIEFYPIRAAMYAYTLRKFNPKVVSRGNMVGSWVKFYTAVVE